MTAKLRMRERDRFTAQGTAPVRLKDLDPAPVDEWIWQLPLGVEFGQWIAAAVKDWQSAVKRERQSASGRRKDQEKQRRNQAIRRVRSAGVPVATLAEQYNLRNL
jgi:hypothetical protein